MSLRKGNASDFNRSCSCISCFFKSPPECSLEEILYVRSYMNSLYFGTYLPLRAKKINGLIKAITERNSLPTINKSNTSTALELKVRENRSQKTQFIDSNHANIYAKNVLQSCNEVQVFPRESARTNLNFAGHGRYEVVQNISNARSQSIACLQSDYQPEYKMKFTKSDPCSSLRMTSIDKLQLGSRQHKANKKTKEMSNGLANTYLQTTQHQTTSLYETRRRKLRKRHPNQICYPEGFVVANSTPVCSSKDINTVKNIHHLSETSIFIVLSNEDNSFCPFSGSFLLHACSTKALDAKNNNSYTVLLVPSSINKSANDRKMQCEKQLRRLKFTIGPYAQLQAVYNVMEQTSSHKKEKGTSQQFKQRSQGIGTGSSSQPVSSNSSSGKRRAVKIESTVSFSIEFFKKDKSTASVVSSDEETAAPKGKTKTKGDKKKSLHRCFCTMSFPTEGRKPEQCASGVCVPGECKPSECFKIIEQKHGKKKKKSGSEASSQASQTHKIKGKEERAGKETHVKEKGSSSISKYKESVEIKSPQKKVNFLTKCCEKLKCWQKDKTDKPIALRRAATDTDIAGKTAGTPQASKKKEKKSKDSVKEMPSKEAKKVHDKKSKKDAAKEATATGDKETSTKKGKGKKSADKEAKAPEVKKEAGKKGKKASGKETPPSPPIPAEDKKAASKKVKKAKEKEVKKAEEKGKKPQKEKKGRPLKPYECEPGVCLPKVCSPQECYNRKFPPKETKMSALKKIQDLFRKCCCRPQLPAEKKTGVSSDAATQSRKAAGPGAPGVGTVYKDKGSVATKKLKPESKKHPQKDKSISAVPEAGSPPPSQKGPGKAKGKGRDKKDQSVSPIPQVGSPPPSPMGPGKAKAKGRRKKVDKGVSQYTDGGDYGVPAESPKTKQPQSGQKAFTGVQYYQDIDNEAKTKRQGVNIGSECNCSVEFYKMIF